MKDLMKYMILILCLLYSVRILAQKESLTLSLDKNEIKIGEQIDASLTLKQSVTSTLYLPSFTDTLSSHIEIVEKGKIDTTYEGNNLEIKVLTQHLTLTSFDTGYHALPPIVIQEGEKVVLSEANLISVKDVEIEMPQTTQPGEEPPIEIKDIKEVRNVDFSIWEWMKENKMYFFLAYLIIALLAIYLKFFHDRIFKKEIGILPKKKVIPPYEIALTELKKLEAEKLWQSGQVKLFHIRLSDIVREYIEEEIKIPAMESTTQEILEDLNKKNFRSDLSTDLVNMLQTSDLVKFAKFIPLGDENDKCLRTAFHIVNETKPVTEVNEEKE